MSVRPRMVRLGCNLNMARRIMPNTMLLRCSIRWASPRVGESCCRSHVLPVPLGAWSSLLRLLDTPVSQEPAWALRDIAADQQDSDPEWAPSQNDILQP